MSNGEDCAKRKEKRGTELTKQRREKTGERISSMEDTITPDKESSRRKRGRVILNI